MGLELEQEEREFDELMAEKRHKEVTGALKSVVEAINSPKEDAELKKLISENKEAINNFELAVREFNKKEVKVDLGFEKMINAISDAIQNMGGVMKGMDKRIQALEDKPRPTRLKAERDRYSGEITYVTIEYLK